VTPSPKIFRLGPVHGDPHSMLVNARLGQPELSGDIDSIWVGMRIPTFA